ncbi:transcriptional regulator, partial [Listeria welshimeri]|nr:transcriptional regulator [Listeria welshimeri]
NSTRELNEVLAQVDEPTIVLCHPNCEMELKKSVQQTVIPISLAFFDRDLIDVEKAIQALRRKEHEKRLAYLRG